MQPGHQETSLLFLHPVTDPLGQRSWPSGLCLGLLVPADGAQLRNYSLPAGTLDATQEWPPHENTDRQGLRSSAESCHSVSQLTSPASNTNTSGPVKLHFFLLILQISEMWKSQGQLQKNPRTVWKGIVPKDEVARTLLPLQPWTQGSD